MTKRIIALLALPALAGAAAAQPAKSPAPPPQAQPVLRTGFIANMDAEFKKMDSDHDGIVVKKEVENFQRVQALAQARINNQRLFAALDVDHNNLLTPAEFSRLTNNPPPGNSMAMLQRFDTNHDGKINMVEFRAGTLANFDRLDADKDGMVTPAEMKAGGIAPK